MILIVLDVELQPDADLVEVVKGRQRERPVSFGARERRQQQGDQKRQ